MNAALFEPIQREQLDQVKLMNRIDQKFWFHEDHLPKILQSVNLHYYVLDIEGQTEFPYTSTYNNTPENGIHIKHHNGNHKRYKIRHRSSISSGASVLEVAFKNNKGRTLKQCIPADINDCSITKDEYEFSNTNSPYTCWDMSSALTNQFSRTTLVNRNFKERCTIDRNLQYTKNGSRIKLDKLVNIEIKTDGRQQNLSPLAQALMKESIKVSGCSKYDMGRILTDRDLRRNSFKRKIRQIQKAIDSNGDLYQLNGTI